MLKSFKTKELVFLTLMGVVLSLNDIFFSNALTGMIGIPASGTIITTIIFATLITIGAFTIRKFGSIAIMAGIWGFLYGLSGASGGLFIIRFTLAIIVGLIIDIIISLFRYKLLGYYIALIFGNAVSIPISVGVYNLLKAPGAEKLQEAMWLFTLITAILALLGVLLGHYIYNRIKNKNFVRQISS
jgi:hypothetical protein